jgi:hypothetical protein
MPRYQITTLGKNSTFTETQIIEGAGHECHSSGVLVFMMEILKLGLQQVFGVQ